MPRTFSALGAPVTSPDLSPLHQQLLAVAQARDEELRQKRMAADRANSAIPESDTSSGQTTAPAMFIGSTANDTDEQRQTRSIAMDKANTDQRLGAQAANIQSNQNYDVRRRQNKQEDTRRMTGANAFDPSTEKRLNLRAMGTDIPDVEQEHLFEVQKAAALAKTALAKARIESRGLAVGGAAGGTGATPALINAAASNTPDAEEESADEITPAAAVNGKSIVPSVNEQKVVPAAHIARQIMIMKQMGLIPSAMQKIKTLAASGKTSDAPALMGTLDRLKADMVARGIPEGEAKMAIAEELKGINFPTAPLKSSRDLGRVKFADRSEQQPYIPFPRTQEIAPSIAEQIAQAGYGK